MESSKKTKLLQWFENNRKEENSKLSVELLDVIDKKRKQGSDLLYIEYPKYYTWDKSKKQWKRRTKNKVCIGRLYTAHPQEGERYFLRILLHHVKGAKSYSDMKTYKNKRYDSFREACIARGLLEDDEEWDKALTDATTFSMIHSIRILYPNLLINGNVNKPYELWLKHKDAMTEDILYKVRKTENNENIQFSNAMYNTAMVQIEAELIDYQKTLKQYSKKIGTNFAANIIQLCTVKTLSEENYNISEQTQMCQEREKQMNEDQLKVYRNCVANITQTT